MLYFLPASFRPVSKWSYTQAVRVRLLKSAVKTMWTVEMKTPLSLKPGKEGKQFVVIEPATSSSYQGIVLKDPEIKPGKLGGTWYPEVLTKETEKADVVIHFHGGAYAIGDGRKADAGYAAKTICQNTPATHVFCPQYRLASNPNCRFPAQLQDAITSLQYVIQTLGVPASRVTISGDSAGGNLALALLRYIHDHPQANLPNPVCAFLWSPWPDPAGSLIAGTFENALNALTDYLTEGFGAWGARTLAPKYSTGITLEHPNIDFQRHPFKTETPLLWSAGECETLYHSIVETYDGFKGIEGNKCELQVEKGAVHDIILTAPVVGFEAEAVLGAKKAGKFLEGLRRGEKALL
jgi:acetyl esterase/lipase